MINSCISPGDLSATLEELLPRKGLVLVSSISAESALFADAVAASQLGDVTLSGIFIPGLNRRTWLDAAHSRTLTFFMTPQLKAAGDRVTFLPLCYQDIFRLFQAQKPCAALFMCSPPDADGNCSFGTVTDLIADMWRDIPVRIAHINPNMPHTTSDSKIPLSEITAYVEAPQVLPGNPASAGDAVSSAIAAHIAPLVPDGATLQTGIGKIPDAVLDALHGHKDLRLHTGLIGDAAMRLVKSSAMAPGVSAIVGVAIGSTDLYAGLDHPALKFAPVSVTHGPKVLGAIEKLVTINSALEADLFGQIYAELTPKGFMSGPGGASDYARGARNSAGGLRIIAFPASAGAISRIILPADARGPVSLGRMDVDIIATEYGAADLRNATYEQRAQSLIAIAAPEHRDALSAGWAAFAATF